jgi:simple sugar transport system permease protein
MIRRYLPLLATLALLVVGYAICSVQFKNFMSFRVLGNLLTDNAFLAIAAVGMTFAIISGGIDLSVGSVIALTTILIAVLVEWAGWHPLMAFAAVLVVGGLLGAGMGAIIHHLGLPPFIVTLSGMFLIRGISFQISVESIGVNHEFYSILNDIGPHIGRGRLSLVAMIMLAVVAFGTIVLHRTKFGAYVYAIGGNPTSAKLMGVPVPSVTIKVYTLSSLLAALAGIVFSIYTSAGNSLNCVGVELDAIAAVVIGGTLLTGGSGFMLGTLAGVLLQGLIQTFITFEGTLSSWWTKIIIGFLLFSFILLQRLITRIGRSR